MENELTQPNEALATVADSRGIPIGFGTPFVCPHPTCRAYARHLWGHAISLNTFNGSGGVSSRQSSQDDRVVMARCTACDRESIFVNGKLIFPQQSAAPVPSSDLPQELQKDFEEARQILPLSSRGSAALLRLIVQKLLPHLGATKSEINAGIAELVANGTISIHLQRALDSVRVIGNEAVHPGTIDLRDDETTALALFGLVNFIVQKAITEPKEVERIYNSLPAAKLAGISQRDAIST